MNNNRPEQDITPEGPVYAKRAGLFRNPAVRRELQQLDPERDYQRMVQLLVGYEFPFDTQRALELALFHTYANPRTSALLVHTGEFERHGQKRYDDTAILISWFMQYGLNTETGLRAITQMNRIHGHYRIRNDDFLIVLSTFIFYPINWINRYGWRKLTPAEERAFFLFFREVGQRMNLTDVPQSLPELRTFTDDYEAEHFRYDEVNRRLADATVRIVQGWLPGPLRFGVKPVFAALINDKLREAFGYERPPRWFSGLLEGALWLRKIPLRWITFKPYPTLVENTLHRSYRSGLPAVEELGPTKLLQKEPR
ncbi:oxygenase MpaB family protein [Larkinella insperata]|uniref:Oxygenase MpaB family protein n=1 Tax=Larkinella insperata TaxID=332158 RepID=A0ABW3Q143_9BACT|nr:oxygenase MpaB family protein [Larkinella insperata]